MCISLTGADGQLCCPVGGDVGPVLVSFKTLYISVDIRGVVECLLKLLPELAKRFNQEVVR